MHKSKKKVMALNNIYDQLFLILPIFPACMCVLTEGMQGQGYAEKYLELRGRKEGRNTRLGKVA
jgi:hypothetical protein